MPIMIQIEMSDAAILRELGGRLKKTRLNQNITQQKVADDSGVSLKTVKNLESGRSGTLTTFIAVLRGMNMLTQLNTFLPDPGLSPIELAKLQGRQRQRASGNQLELRDGDDTWEWGE